MSSPFDTINASIAASGTAAGTAIKTKLAAKLDSGSPSTTQTTAAAVYTLSANAGYDKGIVFETGGIARWGVYSDTTAESGSNAGSAFTINAYDDTGVVIDSPISIARVAGGILALRRPVNVTGNLIASGRLGAAKGIPGSDANTGYTFGTDYDTGLFADGSGSTGSNLYITIDGSTITKYSYTNGVTTKLYGANSTPGNIVRGYVGSNTDSTAAILLLAPTSVANVTSAGFSGKIQCFRGATTAWNMLYSCDLNFKVAYQSVAVEKFVSSTPSEFTLVTFVYNGVSYYGLQFTAMSAMDVYADGVVWGGAPTLITDMTTVSSVTSYATPTSYAFLNNAIFTLSPSVPTPGIGDNSLLAANTSWVNRRGIQATSTAMMGITSTQTLTSAMAGEWGQVQASGLTVTLPLTTNLWAGWSFTLIGGQYGCTVASYSTAYIYGQNSNTSSTSYSLLPGQCATFVCSGAGGAWYVQLSGFDSTAFKSSKATSGYQFLPGGLIYQWGVITNTQSTSYPYGTGTYPIAFPTACLGVFGNASMTTAAQALSTSGPVPIVGCLPVSGSLTQFTWRMDSNVNATFTSGGTLYWYAIGY